MKDFETQLSELARTGNLRHIPADQDDMACGRRVIDLSSNDYLGIAANTALNHSVVETALSLGCGPSASASRLLAAAQRQYTLLEDMLDGIFTGRRSLIFNSGYHANTGIIQALADKDTLVVADRLVHASIIDGITLSRAQLARFRHNDYAHLATIIDGKAKEYKNVLVITESVFSMDGDTADIDTVAEIAHRHPGAMLYVDEAHSFGVLGTHGRGLVEESSHPAAVDIVVATFGKAIGSVGAFAAVSPQVREYLVNKARSFIFSTALPPLNIAITRLLLEHAMTMDSERARLHSVAATLHNALQSPEASHIQPLVVGDAALAVRLSKQLLDEGVKVLPIRTPTVPPGTERLRFSLSAALSDEDIRHTAKALEKIMQ